jgi:hypothetical protein
MRAPIGQIEVETESVETVEGQRERTIAGNSLHREPVA